MRILYDSKQPQFKTPFGTLTPGQVCTLHIHIPTSVLTTKVTCVFNHEDGSWAQNAVLAFQMKKGAYDVFEGQFSIPCPGLFFYYFVIDTQGGSFRLFKQGDDTNMEAGDLWQLSCIPADFTTPDWAKGATIYQVFPDRFYASGRADVTGKLKPYTIHKNWYDEVDWKPTPDGQVLNNDFFGGNFQGIRRILPLSATRPTPGASGSFWTACIPTPAPTACISTGRARSHPWARTILRNPPTTAGTPSTTGQTSIIPGGTLTLCPR